MDKLKKKGAKIEWYEFAHYFCYLAYLSICYLNISERDKEKLSKDYGLNKVIGNKNFHLYPHNEDLIIPIIYNSRHAIELFWKGLIRFKGKITEEEIRLKNGDTKKENEIFYSHNLEYIYLVMINRYKKKIEENKEFEKSLKKLEKISKKFERMLGKIDKQNMMFKYPENKKGGKSLFQRDLRKISTNKNLEDFKQNLEKTFCLFNKIGSQLYANTKRKNN